MRRARRATTRPALWSPDGVEPLPGTTYLEHLERLLPSSGRGPLPGGGRPLPDGPEPDPGGGDAPLLAAAAVLEACRNPLGTTSAHTVADRLTALEGPQDVDRMLEAIRLDLPVSRLRLAELGRWLCRFGVHAGGGLALLGISGTPGDVALVSRLGLLDAVTLYAAVALRNLVPAAQAETALFDLAKQVEARGRIHCSPERLLSLKTIDHYLRGDARRNTNLTDRGRAELRVLLDRALDRADWRRSEGRPG